MGSGASHGSGPGNHIPSKHSFCTGDAPPRMVGCREWEVVSLPPSKVGRQAGGGCLVSLLAGIAGGVAKVGGHLLRSRLICPAQM